jgi:hypothetical protein
MTPTPRKVRSGRRQFGPEPGTDQEWAQVMESPHVKRAFADPAIQQALMQHMQQQASAAGPAPVAPVAPVAMSEGGALHFDTGGVNTAAEIHDLERQIADLPEGEKKNNLRMRLATVQSQQSASPLSIPGGGTVSGSSMNGLNQMVKPPTMGNTALAAGMGALMGAGNTSNPGLGALMGAGLSGALSYLIRKYGKGAQGQHQLGSHPGGDGGGSATDNPNVTTSTGSPNTTASATTTPGGTTEVQPAEAWKKSQPASAAPTPPLPQNASYHPAENASPTVTIPDAVPPGATPPGKGSLMMGTGSSDSGNVVSWDGGKSWVDKKTRQPYNNVVLNQSQVDPGSSLNAASVATTPPPPSPTTDPSEYGWGVAFAEGGPVEPVEPAPQGLKSALVRRPVAVPVTTIVITAKPKKPEKKTTKKAGGGVYPKTQLLPPKRGPQNHEDRPRAHGRVQVPRGSGAAIKGKRFGGIY